MNMKRYAATAAAKPGPAVRERRTSPVYHFAVHPLHNPAKLIEEYQPLMDYLNGRLKV